MQSSTHYLTRITLPIVRARECGLTSDYHFHQALYHCFGSEQASQRCLFRTDTTPFGDLNVLLLSPTEPKPLLWGAWKSQPLAVDTLIQNNRIYHFQLAANVTRTEMGTGRRLPLKETDQQLAWLDRKGLLHGFKITEAFVDRTEIVKTPAKNAVHFVVHFKGLLACTDSDKLAAAFTTGIGRAKAFGCGMLSLKPVS